MKLTGVLSLTSCNFVTESLVNSAYFHNFLSELTTSFYRSSYST
jgi:hypothetical protein